MFLEYGRGRIYMRHRQWSKAWDHFIAATQCPSRRPDFLPTVYLRLAEVAIQQVDREGFEWALAAVESSDRVAGRVSLPRRPKQRYCVSQVWARIGSLTRDPRFTEEFA